MGVFDFLFGEAPQTGQMDPQTQAARDFLMNQMLMQYSAGPANVPTYAAMAPSATYSGTNSLLASLGLEGVSAPDLPTTTIGGREVYTSEPYQTRMERDFRTANPAQYDYLRSFYMDPVTGKFGSRSYGYADPMTAALAAQQSGGGGGGGGGSYVTPRPSPTTSINTPLSYLPGGANDPFLTSGVSQSIARMSTPSGMTRNNDGSLTRTGSAAPTSSPRPVARPDSFRNTSKAEDSFGSDLSRSLSDSSYDPPGTVVSRAISRIFGS